MKKTTLDVLILESNLSMNQIALKSKLSCNYIKKIRDGVTPVDNISVGIYNKICYALGVDPSKQIREENCY